MGIPGEFFTICHNRIPTSVVRQGPQYDKPDTRVKQCKPSNFPVSSNFNLTVWQDRAGQGAALPDPGDDPFVSISVKL